MTKLKYNYYTSIIMYQSTPPKPPKTSKKRIVSDDDFVVSDENASDNFTKSKSAILYSTPLQQQIYTNSAKSGELSEELSAKLTADQSQYVNNEFDKIIQANILDAEGINELFDDVELIYESFYAALTKSNKLQQHMAQHELYPRHSVEDWPIFNKRVKHMALLYLRYNNVIQRKLGNRFLGDGNVKFVSIVLAFIHTETRVNPRRPTGGNFDTELKLMIRMFCNEYYGVPTQVYRSDTFAKQQQKIAAFDEFVEVKTNIHANILLIERLFISFDSKHNEQISQFVDYIMLMPGGKRKSTKKSKKMDDLDSRKKTPIQIARH